MIQALIKDAKYEGKYVVIKGFNDPTVISEGVMPREAYEKALEKGRKRPVLLFVPPRNMAQIY